MLFTVHHETRYGYSEPVTFAPHLLRLHPRADTGRLLAYDLHVDPAPSSIGTRGDAFGNTVTEVTFAGPSARSLVIGCHMQVETHAPEALLRARSLVLPLLPWTEPTGSGLAAYWGSAAPPEVRAFADEIRVEQGGHPLPFLDRLAQSLFDRTERGIRTEGPAQPAGVTLQSRRGACRDLAVLFLAACRSQGVAGRFVSGYQAKAQTPDGQRYLHGWAEVYIDGAGWCGWDPMHGIAAGDGHLALCAAPDQASTMPVEGGFFAHGVSSITSTLDWSLRIATG